MTLNEIYKKETGNDAYECFDGMQYSPTEDYVKWLEKKIEKLTPYNSGYEEQLNDSGN